MHDVVSVLVYPPIKVLQVSKVSGKQAFNRFGIDLLERSELRNDT